MLYDRQAMMAIPICASMLTDRLLVNTLGANSSTRANRVQITQRPTL
jgi:hypothetical protein